MINSAGPKPRPEWQSRSELARQYCNALQGRGGVARQKSRLGINRSKSSIQKHLSLGSTPAPNPMLTPASLQDTPMLYADPSSPIAAPRSAPPALAGAALAAAPSLLTSAGNPSCQTAVVQRLSSVAHMTPAPPGLGGSVPRLDRMIGPAPRRAPHLAGTRVKIFCSQPSRAVSSVTLSHQADNEVALECIQYQPKCANQSCQHVCSCVTSHLEL